MDAEEESLVLAVRQASQDHSASKSWRTLDGRLGASWRLGVGWQAGWWIAGIEEDMGRGRPGDAGGDDGGSAREYDK